jgi:GNAT superfamily N-acetyltransferase
MNDRLTIRPLEPADRAEWQRLWDGYNAFYGRSGETALSPAITQMTWSRFFDADEPMHAMVAQREGELLGLAHFLYHRNTTQLAPVCFLQDLFTVEAARGGGVGRALIEAVVRRATQAGAPRLYWHTRETNLAAMRLYDKVADKPGFVLYNKTL